MHTLGPLEARQGDTLNPARTWGVVKLLPRETCEQIDGDDSGYGSRTEVVAEICDGPTAEDDARLFAAAPDLLAALKEFVDSTPECDTDNPRVNQWCMAHQSKRCDISSRVLPMARAAIAKAEGKDVV